MASESTGIPRRDRTRNDNWTSKVLGVNGGTTVLMKRVNIYLGEEREDGIKVDGIKVNAERE